MSPALLIVLALMVMVVVHELGHFLAARFVGIRATKFYVFFPPALWKYQRGDVEYGLGAIPLGGFVKLPGMFPPSGPDSSARLEHHAARLDDVATHTEQVWIRLRELRAAGQDDLVDALRAVEAAVAEVAAQLRDPAAAAVAAKMIRAIDALVDDCHPQAYWRAALWRRMTVILAGPAVNLVTGLAMFIVLLTFAAPAIRLSDMRVDKVQQGSPAAQADVRKGDRIVSWNGTDFTDVREITAARSVARSLGKPTVLRLRRDGVMRTLELRPAAFKGSKQQRRLGINLGGKSRTVHERQRVGTAVRQTGVIVRDLTVGNLRVFTRIFEAKEREKISSVVGIVKYADDQDEAGRLWHYMAAISLVLAIFNLLPLLPLDGGHVLFGILEAARRGRSLPRVAFERYSVVGFALLMGLFWVGLSNDLRV